MEPGGLRKYHDRARSQVPTASGASLGDMPPGSERGPGSILIVDDDDPFRAFVATILSTAGFAAREAASGEEAFASVRADVPALVLLDVCLPQISGFQLCRQLRDQFGTELPIIFVSGLRTEPLDRSVGLLVGVYRLLARSRPERASVPAPPKLRLTKRELEVLQLLAGGLRHAEIAAKLVISPKTVSSHSERILAKLGVHSRAQAIVLAHEHRLLEGATAASTPCFRYLLHPPDSEDAIGEFTTAVPNWSVGDEFMTGDERRFRILTMLPLLEDEAPYNAMWQVEPLETQ